MQNKNTLTLHTAIRPNDEDSRTQSAALKAPADDIKAKAKRVHVRRMSACERLFRNTAVACTLLLSVMALKNMDTPVTNKITNAVKSVVSMDMELPLSIGNLSFVQKLMPESALVFLNTTGAYTPELPVDGQIVHPYTDKQPWTEYETYDKASVFTLKDGTVEACVQTQEGDYSILIRSEDQTECLYAFIHTPYVKTGDSVQIGDKIGTTGENGHNRLYFEYRKDGASISPDRIIGK